MNYKNLELLILAAVLTLFTVWLLTPLLGYLLRKKKVYMAIFYILFFIPVVMMEVVDRVKKLSFK